MRSLFLAVMLGAFGGSCLVMLLSVGGARASGAVTGGGGGGISQSDGDTRWVNVSGDTMTGALTVSGVTNDITTAGNDDLRLVPGGSGRLRLQSSDSTLAIENAGDTQSILADMENNATARSRIYNGQSAAISLLTDGVGGAAVGTTGDAAATAIAGCFADGISSATARTNLVCGTGGGGIAFPVNQAITIADDGAGTSPSDATVPASKQVVITCNDTDGCTYQPGETSVVDGMEVTVVNASANTVTISDSAGVVEARGTIALAQNERAECSYFNAIWSCQ